MKNCKRWISIMLVTIMMCSPMSFVAIAAENEDGDLSRIYSTIEKYFTYDYRIWDRLGNEITSVFYERMTPYYEEGDIEVVAEYVLQNVGYAEAFVITSFTPPPFSRAYAEHTIVWMFDSQVESTVKDFSGNPLNINHIEAEVFMWFGYDDEENIIITAGAPTVTYLSLALWFGGNEPICSVYNNTYRIADNERSVDFSFTVDILAPTANDYIDSDWLVWRYIKDFTYTARCPS